MQVRKATWEYVAMRRAKGYARETVRNESYTLAEFCRTVNAEKQLARVTRRDVDAFIATQKVSPAALRNKLSALRGFFRWAVANGRLRHDPSRDIDLPKPARRLPRECEEQDVERLFRALPDSRAVLIISLMRQEGLRRAEVGRLEVGDIDATGREVLIHGKGGHERVLPLSDDTLAALRAYLGEFPASSGPLIRSYVHPNRGLGIGQIGKLVVQWMKDAGIKRFPLDGKSAHALRHTMAGMMLDDGADVRDVQAALGHANLTATFVYLKRRQSAARLRGAMGTRSYLRSAGADA